MKLLLSTLGFLFIAAWLIEMWAVKHARRRRERVTEGPEGERHRP